MASERTLPAVPSAPGDRRRGLGQDQHARAPRRAPHRQRRRPAPHPAPDLLAPGGLRDAAARRAHHGAGARNGRRHRGRRAHLGGHVPRHRRAAVARLRRPDRPRPGLHDPRPGGFGRPAEPRPPRARLLADREPLSRQGHLPLDLFALRECRAADRGRAPHCLPVVLRLGRGAARAVRRLCRGQAAAERPRLRRPAALLGADGRRSGAWPRRSAAASTTSSSTSTRTPTACSPRSCWR